MRRETRTSRGSFSHILRCRLRSVLFKLQTMNRITQSLNLAISLSILFSACTAGPSPPSLSETSVERVSNEPRLPRNLMFGGDPSRRHQRQTRAGQTGFVLVVSDECSEGYDLETLEAEARSFDCGVIGFHRPCRASSCG